MPIMYACTDHIRQHCQNNFNITLRAAHSHEIVAAYFGYASNIAQNAETAFLLSKIEEAEVMIPDVDLILHRLTRLNQPSRRATDRRRIFGCHHRLFGGSRLVRWSSDQADRLL